MMEYCPPEHFDTASGAVDAPSMRAPWIPRDKTARMPSSTDGWSSTTRMFNGQALFEGNSDTNGSALSGLAVQFEMGTDEPGPLLHSRQPEGVRLLDFARIESRSGVLYFDNQRTA